MLTNNYSENVYNFKLSNIPKTGLGKFGRLRHDLEKKIEF
jgi:hypothetical protein